MIEALAAKLAEGEITVEAFTAAVAAISQATVPVAAQPIVNDDAEVLTARSADPSIRKMARKGRRKIDLAGGEYAAEVSLRETRQAIWEATGGGEEYEAQCALVGIATTKSLGLR